MFNMKKISSKMLKSCITYAIAFLVCTAVVITSYYINTKDNHYTQKSEETIIQSPVLVSPVPLSTPKPYTQSSPSEEEMISEEAMTSAEPPFSLPSFGEIILPYDEETLSYNNFFNDWRTHTSIDFSAAENSEVYASADGTVQKIYTDDIYGLTVILSHYDQLKTVYSSLDKTAENIVEGALVKRGDIIAYAGNSCVFEKEYGNHLHFTATNTGKPFNPFE